jgi:hypothetical protein
MSSATKKRKASASASVRRSVDSHAVAAAEEDKELVAIRDDLAFFIDRVASLQQQVQELQKELTAEKKESAAKLTAEKKESAVKLAAAREVWREKFLQHEQQQRAKKSRSSYVPTESSFSSLDSNECKIS